MRFEYNLGRVTKLGLIQSGQVSTGEGDSLVEDQGIYQGRQLRIFPLHQERFPLTDQLSLGRVGPKPQADLGAVTKPRTP